MLRPHVFLHVFTLNVIRASTRTYECIKVNKKQRFTINTFKMYMFHVSIKRQLAAITAAKYFEILNSVVMHIFSHLQNCFIFDILQTSKHANTFQIPPAAF